MSFKQTKDKILTVANKLFGSYGFQKTSMEEIAKIARKAKGSLYYHFPSKEDLFREVVQKEINEIKLQLSVIINDSEYSAEGKLKKYMIRRMELMQYATNFQETMLPEKVDHFEFMDDIRTDFESWEKEKLNLIIKEGIIRKEFNIELDTEVLCDMYIMIIKGLEIPFFVQKKYKHYVPHFDAMSNIILKGLK